MARHAPHTTVVVGAAMTADDAYRLSPYRVLITGSRDWTDRQALGEALIEARCQAVTGPLLRRMLLVSGACPTGADRMAETLAEGWGWLVERHPADWERYGKAAGFRRNAEMVALGAEVCLAFIKNDSRGASHTADLAEKAGIPTIRTLASGPRSEP